MIERIRIAQREREGLRLLPYALFLSDVSLSENEKEEINALVKSGKIKWFKTINGIGLYENECR